MSYVRDGKLDTSGGQEKGSVMGGSDSLVDSTKGPDAKSRGVSCASEYSVSDSDTESYLSAKEKHDSHQNRGLSSGLVCGLISDAYEAANASMIEATTPVLNSSQNRSVKPYGEEVYIPDTADFRATHTGNMGSNVDGQRGGFSCNDLMPPPNPYSANVERNVQGANEGTVLNAGQNRNQISQHRQDEQIQGNNYRSVENGGIYVPPAQDEKKHNIAYASTSGDDAHSARLSRHQSYKQTRKLYTEQYAQNYDHSEEITPMLPRPKQTRISWLYDKYLTYFHLQTDDMIVPNGDGRIQQGTESLFCPTFYPSGTTSGGETTPAPCDDVESQNAYNPYYNNANYSRNDPYAVKDYTGTNRNGYTVISPKGETKNVNSYRTIDDKDQYLLSNSAYVPLESSSSSKVAILSVSIPPRLYLLSLLAVFYSFIPYLVFNLIFAFTLLRIFPIFVTSHIMLCVILAVLVCEFILKRVIKQPRPIQSAVKSYGMPSAHCGTTMAVVMWSTFQIFFANPSLITPFQYGLLLVSLLPVPWARYHLKDHSFSQCLAGSAIGTLIATAVFVGSPMVYPLGSQ